MIGLKMDAICTTVRVDHLLRKGAHRQIETRHVRQKQQQAEVRANTKADEARQAKAKVEAQQTKVKDEVQQVKVKGVPQRVKDVHLLRLKADVLHQHNAQQTMSNVQQAQRPDNRALRQVAVEDRTTQP